MKRVLVLSQIFPPTIGGSGRWLWEIYSRFPEGAASVFTTDAVDGATFDQSTPMHIGRIPFSFPSWGITNLPTAYRYLRQLWTVGLAARRMKVDEIHTGRALPEGWVALMISKLFGIPYRCFVHGEDVCYARGSRELGWMTRRTLENAAGIVANSQSTRRLLLDDWGVDAERISVLNPGVDTAAYQPAEPGAIAAAKNDLGWQGRSVVLTVGRLQERKGQDTMIRALQQLRERIPNILYSIVGDGDDAERLRRLSEELGVQDHVDFRGAPNDADLIRCYQSCDLFVLANRQVGDDLEGFGIVLLEAQACGRPVVAGASGGPSETMDAPHTGRVVSGVDVDELASVIESLLAEPEALAKMGHAARAWTVERFDWTVQGERAKALLAG